MKEQPEALRLADEITDYSRYGPETEEQAKRRRMASHSEAAAELRRLHEANQELLEAAQAFSDYVRVEQCSTDGAVTYSNTQIHRLAFMARAAIAKSKGA